MFFFSLTKKSHYQFLTCIANDTEELKPAMYEPVPSTVKDCSGHYEVANSVESNQTTPLPCAEYEMCDTDLTEEVKKFELYVVQHLNSFFNRLSNLAQKHSCMFFAIVFYKKELMIDGLHNIVVTRHQVS